MGIEKYIKMTPKQNIDELKKLAHIFKSVKI